MKVALLNVKFSPNLGDGLLSECLEGALEGGGRQIEVRSIDLAGRTAFSAGNALRGPILVTIQSLPRILRYPLTYLALKLLVGFKLRRLFAEQLSDVDAVVLGGGNLIADSDFNFPIKIAAALVEATRRNLPVAVFGVGVSDYWSVIGRATLRQAFANTPLIDVTVRDARSQAVWNTLLAGDVIPVAGLARDPGLLAGDRYGIAAERSPGGPIGLCLTSPALLRYHAADDAVVGDIADWYRHFTLALVDAGYDVVLFTNGSPEDRSLRDAMASELLAAGRGKVSCASDFATPDELVRFISGCSLIVAHRMHACIAAYAIGIPAIGLSWDPKLDSFFAIAGRDDFIVMPNRTTLDDLVVLVRRALDEPPDRMTHAELLAKSRADVDRLATLLVDAVDARR